MSIKKLIDDIKVVNLAIGMDEQKVSDIGKSVYDGYQDDEGDQKRKKWAKDLDEYIDYAMQVTQEKSDPWEGCANIKMPMLTEAAIQFNARSYPALVPATQIVKCSTTGDDSQGNKSERGDRVGKHMTYQLREEMEEWEDDQDKLLIMLPICGCVFKKTYFSPDLGRNVSKVVKPTNLIVKYDSPTLERAPRLSEKIEVYPREVTEKQRAKEWLDVDIEYVDKDKEKLETFITQHTYLDIRNTGLKIPYIVTIHEKTQTVVRIQANYGERDIWYNDGTEVVNVGDVKFKNEQTNQQIENQNIEALAIGQAKGLNVNEIVQIPKEPAPSFKKYTVIRVKPTKIYTKYSFLPSPDGNIYDLGLGQLLGPLLDAADTLVNQMLDAGSLANSQGGFMAEGLTTQSGTIRAKINEFVKVKTTGMSLKDAIIPFKFPGPSATAFSLLGFLVDSAKAIANLKDILSGDAPQGETATTSVIKREEGMRVYNAIYKRIYRAFKKELQIIYMLNSEYLPEETYLNVLDTPEAIKAKDYSYDKTDVRPVADPSESMQSQKIVKAEAGLRFVGDPECNAYELKKRYFEAIEMPNIDEILPPPSNKPKPPDPLLVKTVAEVQEIEARTAKTLKEIGKVHSEIIKNLADAESKEIGQQLEVYKKEADAIIKKGELDERRRERMEGQPGDQEGIQVPTGTPGAVGEVGTVL